MKTWLPNPIAIDALFRNKLEELPIDLGNKALHWQQVKQQLSAGIAPPAAHPVSVSPIIGSTVAGLLLLIVGIQQIAMHHTAVPGQSTAAPATTVHTGAAATGTTGQDSQGRLDTGLSVSMPGITEKTFRPVPTVPAAPANSLPPGRTDSPAITPPAAPVVQQAKKDSVAPTVTQPPLQDSVFIFW